MSVDRLPVGPFDYSSAAGFDPNVGPIQYSPFLDAGSNPGVYNYGASGFSADGQLLDPQLFYSTTPTPEAIGFVPSSTPLPFAEVQQYQVTPSPDLLHDPAEFLKHNPNYISTTPFPGNQQ